MKKLTKMLVVLAVLLDASALCYATTESVQDITAILISIKVEDKPSLFILLAGDGTINRMGTGTRNNTERNLYIALTKEKYFEKLRSAVRPVWLEHQGVYDVPEKQGKLTELAILFAYKDGAEGGLTFLYGSTSQGPPADICDFITLAVNLTEPWYQEWKSRAKSH